MKRASLIYLAALLPIFGSAQSKGGLHRNPLSVSIPVQETPLRAEYNSLPLRYTLEVFAPPPKVQINGSCTGFAAAYSARSIAWNFRHGLTTNETKLAFDPYFHYNLIKFENDSLCENGAYPEDGFLLLEEIGAVPDGSMSSPCEMPDSSLLDLAKNYRVSGIQKLFDNVGTHPVYSDTSKYYKDVSDHVAKWDSIGFNDRDKRITGTIKKFLFDGSPILIGIPCFKSYYELKLPNDRLVYDKIADTLILGFHSMTIIGYDDEKYGGAFLLMNSLDEKLLGPGFIWISYKDLLGLTNDIQVMFDFGKENGFVTLKGENGLTRISGEVCNNKKCGVWKTYDQNGNLISEISYREGVRHGITKVYFPSGKIRSTCLYNRGKQNHEFLEWNEKGKIIAKGDFMMGRGEVAYYYGEYSASGKEEYGFCSEEWEFKRGRRTECVGGFADGYKNGRWVFYNERGKTRFTCGLGYDELYGLTRYQDGKRIESIDTYCGMFHGHRMTYFSNGTLKERFYYTSGEVVFYQLNDEKTRRPIVIQMK